MLPRSEVGISRSDIKAEYLRTQTDGAAFRFGINADGISPEEAARRSRSALDVVDAFLEGVLDGIEDPMPDWDGIGAFDEWSCEGPEMAFKYSGLGGDWNAMMVIIRDRYLATCFRQEFCRELPPSD